MTCKSELITGGSIYSEVGTNSHNT
jgi:hypothetical protein